MKQFKRISHWCLSAVGWWVLLPGLAVGQAPIYNTANFVTEDANLSVVVNGFPLYSIPQTGNQGSESSNIGRFLKRGGNEIILQATPMVALDGTLKPSHLFSAEIYSKETVGGPETSVLKVERLSDTNGDEPNTRTTCVSAGRTLAMLRSNGANDGGVVQFKHATSEVNYRAGTGGTTTISVTLDLPLAPLESLPWQAEAVAPTAGEVETIRQTVLNLRNALQAQNWDSVEAILDFKYDRMATAMGATKSAVADATKGIFQKLFASDGFSLQPLAAADLVISQIPGLNLIRVEKSGAAPIVGSGTEVSYEMAIYFSKVNGVWMAIE
ncbi:MAG: hypothetical protein WCJ66_15085 [Verrucomicrobiota bacterium]